MDQRKPVTRIRPANEILSDLEDRLRSEGQLPAKLFTRTLELTKLSAPNEEQAIEAGKKLLQPRSFAEAAEVYMSVIASKELTEQRKRESDEKSQSRQLSEKEVGWRELMDRELERKNKLLNSLNDYFTKKPKKIEPELAKELGLEI